MLLGSFQKRKTWQGAWLYRKSSLQWHIGSRLVQSSLLHTYLHKLNQPESLSSAQATREHFVIPSVFFHVIYENRRCTLTLHVGGISRAVENPSHYERLDFPTVFPPIFFPSVCPTCIKAALNRVGVRKPERRICCSNMTYSTHPLMFMRAVAH